MKAIFYKPNRLLFIFLTAILPFFAVANKGKKNTANNGPVTITLGTISPSTYCAGDAVNVPFTVTGTANPGNVFSVMFFDPTTFAPQIVIASIASTSSGSFNLTGTIPANTVSSSYRIYILGSDPVASSVTATVTVYALTSVSAGSYSALTTIDPPVTLSGTPSGGTFSGTGVVGSTFDPSVSGVGTFPITYSYTNANGCTSTDVTNISVTCGFSAGSISGPSSACAYMGTGIDASYTVVGAVNASSYTWSTQGSNLNTVAPTNTINGTIHYAVGYGTGHVKVSVGNGCGGSPVLLDMLTSSAIPNTPGTISGPTDVCAYLGSSAIYSIAPIQYATSYTWTLPGTVTGSSTSTSITAGFPSGFVSGTIQVASTNACGSSSVKTLNVHSAANLPATFTPTNATAICPPTTITFTTSNTPGYTYTWNAPGTTGSSITNSIALTFPGNPGGWGGGWITVTATNACGSSSPKGFIYNLQGGCRMQSPISSVPAFKTNSLFPNPSNGNFVLVFDNSTKLSVAEITITNEFGQVVYQSTERNISGRIKLDLESKLTNGMYLVTSIVDGKKIVQKLLVNK